MTVFLDVLPRLGLTEAEAAFAKLKGMADKVGKEMGLSLKTGAESGLAALEKGSIAAERTVSDSYRKMTVSALQYEAQVKKVAEVEAARGKDSAVYAAAMAKQADLEGKAATATRDYSDAALVATASSTKFASAKEGVGKSGASMAGVLNGVGLASVLAVGAAMDVSAKKAADFEQSQTKLVASAGESAQGMKQLSDGILQMAGTVGYSAGDLSSAMYVVEKAGFDAAKGGLDVLKASAQGANVEQADLAEVTKGLTISMNDFHFPTQNAADVMSKLVVATGASTATFQEFTGALHSVEPAAANAQIKYEDLLAVIARGTKSGASADQVTENIRNAISALSGASGPARDAMNALNISADDVSQHLGQRGLAGTFQYLADTIKDKMDPNHLIPTGEFKKNAGELDNMTNSLTAMSPAAAKMSEGLRNGTVTARQYQMAIRASTGDDTARMKAFQTASNDLNDFSKRYKNGQSTLVTYNEELRKVTGTVAGQSIALQVTGENAKDTNDLIALLNATTREHDGTVKGFNESQEKLNAKMRDAKAAFGTATTELGDLFIPALKKAADALKDIVEFMAAHKDLAKDAAIAVGGIATAWIVAKGVMVFGTVIDGIKKLVTAFGTIKTAATTTQATIATTSAAEVAEVESVGAAAETSASRIGLMARAALRAAPVVAALYAAPHIQKFENDNIPGMSFLNGLPTPENLLSDVSGYLQGDDNAFSNIKGMGTARDQAEAALKAKQDAAKAPKTPGTLSTTKTGGALPIPDSPNDGTDPGIPGGGTLSTTGAGGKPPKGDKNDPIWITPQNSSDFKSDDKHGETGTDIITKGTDFSPQGIAKFFTALLINQALGNPVGKGLAAKRGESPSSPMYVTSVDVDRAQKELDKAIHNDGPDSAAAVKASEKLAGTQAAVGTTGGYFDPKSGAITPHAGGNSAVPLTQKADGTWTSSNPAWAHLIGRESSGINQRQGIHDVNSGGNEAEGLFQITPATWKSHGGTEFAPSALAATPQQQGDVAARILQANPSGSDWGAGLAGRENAQALLQGLQSPLTNSDGGSLDNYMGGGGRGLRFKKGPQLGPASPAGPGGTIGPFPVPAGVTTPGIGNSAQRSLTGSPTGSGTSGWTSPTAAPGGAYNPGPATTAGASTAPSTYGSGKGASTSIGATAAGALGGMPGAAQAGQLLDRTIGFGAQLGGIAAEGLMQTFLPGGGGGMGDPSKSWIGKLAGGLAGAHKSAPNSAGTTKPPVEKADDGKDKPGGGDTTHIGSQTNGGINVAGDMHVSTPDANSFKGSTADQNQYPTSTR